MSGDGVAINYRLGASWFQKAADLGNAEAMYELATFHIEGDGVEADPDKVKHWMFKAAALGQEQAVDWVNENYPEQPDWLQNLKKGVQDLPVSDLEPDKTASEDVTKPEDKDETE
jgi:TPR repeat protein